MITSKKMNSFKQKHFTGESTDNKPTTCGVNSLFVEIDTGDTYFFDGYQWIKAELPEHGGITPTGNIAITENTTEPLDIAQYATATVNVPAPAPEKHYVIPEGSYTSIVDATTGMAGIYIPNSYFFAPELFFTIDGVTTKLIGSSASDGSPYVFFVNPDDPSTAVIGVYPDLLSMLSGVLIRTTDTEPTAHTVSAYYEGEKRYWQVFGNSAQSSDPLQLLGNFLQTVINTSGYSLTMTTFKQSITAGACSFPLEVYPWFNSSYIAPFVYSVVDITEITTSTTVAQGNVYYDVSTNEDNLAFITYERSVS